MDRNEYKSDAADAEIECSSEIERARVEPFTLYAQ